MSYNIKILADSLAPCGKRLTTWELTYPRFIHAEVLTHRLFSRNSASSRAIPSAKLVERVQTDPVLPKWWGKNQTGMAAETELIDIARIDAEAIWLRARDSAVAHAQVLADLGLHKQIANRVIEPWMFITVILSATEFDNFFKLRCSPAAQPEFRWVAEHMRELYETRRPTPLGVGHWHLPLWGFDEDLEDGLSVEDIKRIAVARCARVSYLTHDGRRAPAEDLALYDRLKSNGHWSPFEHVAQALDEPKRIGNFIGWCQHRADVDPDFLW